LVALNIIFAVIENVYVIMMFHIPICLDLADRYEH